MSTNVRANYNNKYFRMTNVLAQKGILMTDQEFRLLSYYTSFPTSWTFIMGKIQKDLGWCESKIKKTRQSLQEKGYLLIRRLPKNEFIYYIGKGAVRDYLLDKQKKEDTTLTAKEIEILQETETPDDMIIFNNKIEIEEKRN